MSAGTEPCTRGLASDHGGRGDPDFPELLTGTETVPPGEGLLWAEQRPLTDLLGFAPVPVSPHQGSSALGLRRSGVGTVALSQAQLGSSPWAQGTGGWTHRGRQATWLPSHQPGTPGWPVRGETEPLAQPAWISGPSPGPGRTGFHRPQPGHPGAAPGTGRCRAAGRLRPPSACCVWPALPQRALPGLVQAARSLGTHRAGLTPLFTKKPGPAQ